MQREAILLLSAITTAIGGGDTFDNTLKDIGNVG